MVEVEAVGRHKLTNHRLNLVHGKVLTYAVSGTKLT